jgi:hypothetical protein
MARIGDIVIGGNNSIGISGAPILSGVAFDLLDGPEFDFTYIPDGTSWEVELKARQPTVVARTTDRLSRSDVLSTGLEYAQRCLDLMAFERRSEATLAGPGDSHVLLFSRNGALVLQHVDVYPCGVSVKAVVVARDKHGNSLSPNVAPPVWTPGLRFYRLSQTSRDLYEAYRNLFLGLEALLYAVVPKAKKEGEKKWLLRALSQIAAQTNLEELVPKGVTNSPAYIVDTQYDDIRCRLFHAKPSASGKLLDLPDPEKVSAAYEQLVRIWRKIAQSCLFVRGGGGGAMTYVGFKSMFDNAFSNNLSLYCTEDPSPPKKTDTEISPLGKAVHAFHEVKYLGETAPGRVSIVGSQPVDQASTSVSVFRICTKVGDSLFTAGYVERGLDIRDVDIFESLQIFRLVNLDLPKVGFGKQRV